MLAPRINLISSVAFHGSELHKLLVKNGVDFEWLKIYDAGDDAGFEHKFLTRDIDEVWKIFTLVESDPFGNEDYDILEEKEFSSKIEGLKDLKNVLNGIDELVRISILYH